MQLVALWSVAGFVAVAHAHCTVYGAWINGQFQGDGQNQYIRSPPNNNPVKDLTSQAMACNVNNNAVGRFLQVKSGDQLTFEWKHDVRNDDIIATSHKGPVQVYIAPYSSNGQGSVWTKIFSQAYSGNWGVDKLIAAHGQHSVTVPNLPAGQYLFRAEIVALHEADVAYANNNLRGAQIYPSCLQVQVTSNGTNTPPGGSSFPGTYTPTTQGIVFNIYPPYGPDPNTYKAPGPDVWSSASGGSIGQVGSA
ncbi:glycoside hydrolase family 61 protein [Auriculariales sp. MPI-PUGE-AT-0066]|nr:glycoside hydrolase family 61 protein [Auriculariales sp. MPI-PUGE-AT-0066]